MGVVIVIPQLAEHAMAIGFALLGSVALAIGITAILLAFFGKNPRD